MTIPEREVLRVSLKILNSVFKEWVRAERRQSGLFKNTNGAMVRIGKKYEPDIGGYIIRGPYIAKPLAIEVKRGDFRPGRIYGSDKERFMKQCEYLQEINSNSGVGFWINNPTQIYAILMPVLKFGSRISLAANYTVVVTPQPKILK